MSNKEMNELKSKSIFIITGILTGVYMLLVVIYSIFKEQIVGVETEAGWHYIFGMINYPLYILIHGLIFGNRGIYILGYTIYFSLLGIIHWGLIGMFIHWLNSWQAKDEKYERIMMFFVKLIPLFSALALFISYVVSKNKIMNDDHWCNVAYYVPFVGILICVFTKKWLFSIYCGIAFLVSIFCGLMTPWF